MVRLDDVVAMAEALPEVEEGSRYGSRTWFVRNKAFLWERPFSKADVKRFGAAPVPTGDIVAVSTADLAEKDAIIAAGGPALFTIPHFDGYPAYLVQLSKVTKKAMREAVVDGWLAVAPPALADAYVGDTSSS